MQRTQKTAIRDCGRAGRPAVAASPASATNFAPMQQYNQERLDGFGAAQDSENSDAEDRR